MSFHLKRDLQGVLWLTASVFLTASLFSYHPNDPSFYSTGDLYTLKNWCGPIGSYLADFLLQTFGVSSWVVPLLLLYSGLRCFYKKSILAPTKTKSILINILLFLTVSTFLSLHFPKTLFYEQITLGGALGFVLSKTFSYFLDKIGLTIFLAGSFYLLLIMYTEKRVLQPLFWASKKTFFFFTRQLGFFLRKNYLLALSGIKKF